MNNKNFRCITTEKAPAVIGLYSQAVVTGGVIYLSGQISLSPETGEIIGSSITEQTERVIQNIKEVLAASGSSIENVVKTTCFLTDLKNFQEFNAVYAKHFISLPARSTIEVSALPRGAIVEIEAIAVIPSS
jgi:2-iminobutanoate/2-iminopropanoate deaminase